MAADGNDIIIRGIYEGGEIPEEQEDDYGEPWEIILGDVTHLTVDEFISVIPGWRFHRHPSLVEFVCHIGVTKIEESAFERCPHLKRLIMPSVEEVEEGAFFECESFEYVECDELEKVESYAFAHCSSLGSIDLPSARVVKECAFIGCSNLMHANFGKSLESLGEMALANCGSIERITIPLKNGLFNSPLKNGLFKRDKVFAGCDNLKRVDLVDGDAIQETLETLLVDEWRIDIRNEIDSINQILPNADLTARYSESGGKTEAIRKWISRVLDKIISYKAQHRRLTNEAATVLLDVLSNDMLVTKNVLPFLALPSYTFDGEDESNVNLLNSDQPTRKRPQLEGE